jgi:kynurenine 3-monooxygenase
MGATPLNFTKSINLALSERGINALRNADSQKLLNTILDETIPMYGRMIHTRSSTGVLTSNSQAYDVHGRFQRSVDRGGLNKCLLDELDKMPNVKLLFNHKLTGADFHKKKAWFEVHQSKPDHERAAEIEVDFNFMIGSDGAHSAARHHMMKFARMNYQQEYIDCLWCEFTMAPSELGDFRISPNHLHIWPAGSFMFVALPSLDRSFVCTLFGPVDLFVKLENNPEVELVKTFAKYFPGVVPALIAEDDLNLQFKRNPHLPLINIKCSPHHFSDSVVILGDSANAIVPFYGQGMNAGLESVRVLFAKLDTISDRTAALAAYTSERTKDTSAIADLALQNYIEMRSSVTSPLYKLRKYIEERLSLHFPRLGWATQYSRVSFSNMRYSEVISRAKHQKTVLLFVLMVFAGGSSGMILWLAKWQMSKIIQRRRI